MRSLSLSNQPDFREHPQGVELSLVDVGVMQQRQVADSGGVGEVPYHRDLLLDVDDVGVGLPVGEDHLGHPDGLRLRLTQRVQRPLHLQVQVAVGVGRSTWPREFA